MLIDGGAEVDLKNNSEMTALSWAVHDERFKTVKILVDAGADINVENEAKENPILFAAAKGNIDEAKFLLDHGADPNSQSVDKYTPLGWVGSGDNEAIVALFLSYGADTSITDKMDMTPLENAEEYGDNENIVAMLKDAERGRRPTIGDVIKLLPPPEVYEGEKLPKEVNRFITTEEILKEDDQWTLLKRIGVNGMLDKLFTVEIWKNREEEMEKLWENVPFSQQNQVDIDEIKRELLIYKNLGISREDGWKYGI